MNIYKKSIMFWLMIMLLLGISLGDELPDSVKAAPATITASPESKIITLADNGQTIVLKVDETFLLKLGEGYDWTVTVDDQAIISRMANVLVVKGAQGIYKAHKPGRTMLTATGDPVCRREIPPCSAPSREFRLYVIVTGGVPTTPAFRVLSAISALLVALIARR